MPGGKLDIGIGLAENSGGIFALETAFTFSFVVFVVEQAKVIANREQVIKYKKIFDIKNNLTLKLHNRANQTVRIFSSQRHLKSASFDALFLNINGGLGQN